MNKVVTKMELEFAGVVLPVTQCEDGRDVVPLKPIIDAFGMEWRRQRSKVNDGAMAKRLGTCGVHMPHAGQTRHVTCIRLDRVVAYLNSLSPASVRAGGNEDGADFLERKQAEWDDVLHEYERTVGMFADAHQRQQVDRRRSLADYLAISRELRLTEDQEDRAELKRLKAQEAARLGIPYQMELTGT